MSYVASDNMMMLSVKCIITCDYKIMKLYGRYGGVGSNDALVFFLEQDCDVVVEDQAVQQYV